MKIINARPAKFPSNNTEEINSVVTLLDILDKRFIKPDTAFMDKNPSIDGNVIITDKDQFPIGKIEIQIKTLPDKDVAKPKLQCTKKFLAYCEESLLPVILIVVNKNNRLAYWLYINRDYLKTIADDIEGETIVIYFPLENIITDSDTDYIQRWTEIATEKQQRLLDYDKIREELDRLKSRSENFKIFPKPIHSLTDEEIGKLQVFIDTFNQLIERDFELVKELYYSDFWKIGIGYSRFEKTALNYVLYPILKGTNDLIIRELPTDSDLDIDGILWVGHSQRNKIDENPQKYALEEVSKKVLNIVKEDVVQYIDKELAQEYVIAFADYIFESFNNKIKREYHLKTIINRLTKFYPIFVEELNGAGSKDENATVLFDLDIIMRLREDPRTPLAIERAIKRYRCGDNSIYKVSISGDHFFKADYLVKSISFLETTGNDKLVRIYPPLSAPVTTGEYYYPGNCLTTDELKSRIEEIYKNIPRLIDEYMDEFFPNLSGKIQYFDKFDKQIIDIIHDQFSTEDISQPRVNIFYLQSINNNGDYLTTSYINGEGFPIPKEEYRKCFGKIFNVDGQDYKVIGASFGSADFAFENFPLKQRLSSLIHERFKAHFDRILSPTPIEEV